MPLRLPGRLHFWVTLVVLCFLLPSLLAFFSWRFLQEKHLTSLLRTELEHSLQASVDLHIQREGLSTWSVRDLRLPANSDSLSFLELDALSLHLQPSRLFSRCLALDSLVIEGLRIQVDWDEGLPAWLDSLLLAPSAASKLELITWPKDFSDLCQIAASNHFQSDSLRLIFRDLRFELSGKSGESEYRIQSPALHAQALLPPFDEKDFADLALNQWPERHRGILQFSWSGLWEQSKGPLKLLKNEILSMQLKAMLRHHADASIQIEKDTLRASLAWAQPLSAFDFELQQDEFPLPDSLKSLLELKLPLDGSALQLGSKLETLGASLPSTFDLNLLLEKKTTGWQLEAQEDFHLRQPQSKLLARGPLVVDQIEMRLHAEQSVRLDSMGLWREADLSQSMQLFVGALSMREGVQMHALDLEQSFEGRFYTDGTKLRSSGLQATLSLRVDSLQTQAGVDLQALHLRALDLQVRCAIASTDSLEWSLRSRALVDGIQMDCAGDGHLPSVQVLSQLSAESAFPLLAKHSWQLFVDAQELPLVRVDPSLRGSSDLHLHLGTTQHPSFALRKADIFADDQTLLLAFEATLLSQSAFYLSAGKPLVYLPDSLWLTGSTLQEFTFETLGFSKVRVYADELPPIDIQMDARALPYLAELETEFLPLEALGDYAPAAALEAGTGLCKAELSFNLDSTFLLTQLHYDLSAFRLSMAVDPWLMDDGNLQLKGDWKGDRLNYGLKFHANRVRRPSLRAAWEDLNLASEGELDLSLTTVQVAEIVQVPGRCDWEFAAPQMGFEMQGSIACPDFFFPEQSHGTIRMQMQGERRRPWPGLRVTGDMRLDLAMAPLNRRGEREVSGRVDCDLQSLRFRESLDLTELDLFLPFSLTLDDQNLPIESLGSPPPDWETQQMWKRAHAFAPPGRPAGAGWNLRVKSCQVEGLPLKNLAAQIFLEGGRLDVPEFRVQAFEGDFIASSFFGLRLEGPWQVHAQAAHVDSRRFELGRHLTKEMEQSRVDALFAFAGVGLNPARVEGSVRFPDIASEVGLNLLRAMDPEGEDPSIGRLRRYLELPAFPYHLQNLSVKIAHGFARPEVDLAKNPWSPLPAVTIPMSPLPLEFMLKQVALTGDE
jgi:hypothetical protein